MGGVTHWGTLLAEECNWGPVADNAPLGLGTWLHFSLNDENIFTFFFIFFLGNISLVFTILRDAD